MKEERNSVKGGPLWGGWVRKMGADQGEKIQRGENARDLSFP